MAHCGGSLEGDFIWSVTYTDIFSSWTSLRAEWNKGAHGIVVATREVQASLHLAIVGFDCEMQRVFELASFAPLPSSAQDSRLHKDDNGQV